MPREPRHLDPDSVRAWQRIARDTATSLLGIFLCAFAAVKIHDPATLTIVLGAGLTALGLGPALRMDERIRKNGDNGDDDGGFTHMERPK